MSYFTFRLLVWQTTFYSQLGTANGVPGKDLGNKSQLIFVLIAYRSFLMYNVPQMQLHFLDTLKEIE